MKVILSFKMPAEMIEDVKDDNDEDKRYFGYEYCVNAFIQKA
jgi:hypothetical protein